jgi:DNA-binding NarL/FixJ family response regulator
MSKKIKLVVLDDHDLVLKGISSLFYDNEKVEVIGGFLDSESFMDFVKTTKPDVAIIDIRLKNKSGMDSLKSLLEIYPDVKAIILSVHLSINYIYESFNLGARGFFTKNSDSVELVQAVENVCSDDEFHMSGDITTTISDEYMSILKNKDGVLNKTERKIIEMICDGRSTKEIALALDFSQKTIANYKKIILDKFNVKSEVQMALQAVRDRIVSNE